MYDLDIYHLIKVVRVPHDVYPIKFNRNVKELHTDRIFGRKTILICIQTVNHICWSLLFHRVSHCTLANLITVIMTTKWQPMYYVCMTVIWPGYDDIIYTCLWYQHMTLTYILNIWRSIWGKKQTVLTHQCMTW